MHLAAVFGEIHRLFAGGITATHHGQFGLTELGGGAIADGAGADALTPEQLFAGQPKSVGTGAGRQDQGLGLDGLAFGGDQVGPLGEVDGSGIGLHQAGAPAHGLGFHLVHQLRAEDAVGKARIVFNVGGGHQLAAGNAAVLKAGDQQGAQVGPGGVDGCGVAGRAGPHNH